MSAIIEIKDLSKLYGKRTAVHHLNLNVEAGEIFGFVGPNGAGKTTTMRILATLLRANSGEAFIAGHSVKKSPRGVRAAIGYMPDTFGVYHDMRVWEYLDFFGACSPAATRNVVVLPAPFGPSRATTLPSGTSRSMPNRTSMRS